MLYAALLLGLLPAIFLSDIFTDTEEDESEADENPETGEFRGEDNLLNWILPPSDPGVSQQEGQGPGSGALETTGLDPLDPDIEDEMPVQGDPVDPETVIFPDVGDEPPVDPVPVDGPVLDPSEYDEEPGAPSASGALLHVLLSDQNGVASSGEFHDDPDRGTGLEGQVTGQELPLGAQFGGLDDNDDDEIADLEDADQDRDIIWLYHSATTDDECAEVLDFVPGKDMLRITLNPEGAQGSPLVEVSPSMSGEDGTVKVDGRFVAVLRGVPNATSADIQVELHRDVF